MRFLIVTTAIGLPLLLCFATPSRSDVRPGVLLVPPVTVGVASCAAGSCHHGNGNLGSKGSEYSTWIAIDPHAKAYRALFNADSRRIQKNLGGGNAHENPTCLACHGMGQDLPASIQADGVGCEQCHGPAEKWKSSHYLPGFDRSTTGFVDLRELGSRADSCMKCHVGDETREVNHDLIAAGHPRLKFEFAAYYANYPRHWTYRENEERSLLPDQEARLWVVGQAASARAALDLLATRAERSEKNWPEFAEYDCASCHHDLLDESSRRDRASRMVAKGRKPGELPWADWYHVVPRLTGSQALRIRYAAIENEMARRVPRAKDVAREARAAATLLRADLSAAVTAKYAAEQVNRLTTTLARRDDVAADGWDSAAQLYLGLAALSATRDAPVDRKADLKAMRDVLYGSYKPGARSLYDLPTKYDPKKLIPLLKKFE